MIDTQPVAVEPLEATRRPRPLLRGLVVAVVVAVVGAGFVWTSGLVPCEQLQAQPECNVAMLPGPAERVDDLVEVDAPETWGSAGELVLTTIVVDPELTAVEYVTDRIDDAVSVVDRERIYPRGQSLEDARVTNEIAMSDSQLQAKVAALEHLGVDLASLTAGAELVTVLPDTPAEEADLESGDVITAVNGESVDDADAAVARIGSLSPGDEVTLTLSETGHGTSDDDQVDGGGPDDNGTGDDGAATSDDATEVTVTLAENPDDRTRPHVGVLLRDFQVLPYEIGIDAGAIGGPSAGLVFSLAIVDRLTERDLTDGRVVAGTGTITADGTVGPITGVVQKVVGASTRERPAEVFLVPERNFEQAVTARPAVAMTLVPVATLDGAVTALEDLAAGRTPAGAVSTGPAGPHDAPSGVTSGSVAPTPG